MGETALSWEPRGRPAAVLSQWRAFEIAGRRHLVGVLVARHERLPAGRWIVTSPLRLFDPQDGRAVTGSSVRHYLLLDPMQSPTPQEVFATIAMACRTWRVDEGSRRRARAGAVRDRAISGKGPSEPSHGADDRSM